MTLPIDYGPVDPNVTEPRYTDLERVKARIQIPLENLNRDDELTEAIVAAEYAIDVELGRSFPDGLGVDGESLPGPVTIVPSAVVMAATQTTIAVWKEADAPIGTAGSDAFLGAIDVADAARRIISRSVTLRGFRVGPSFGVA